MSYLEVKLLYATFSRAPESFPSQTPTVLKPFPKYSTVLPSQQTQPCDCHSSAQMHTGLLSWSVTSLTLHGSNDPIVPTEQGLVCTAPPGFHDAAAWIRANYSRAIFILPVSSQKIALMPSSGWGHGPYPVLLAAGNYPQKIWREAGILWLCALVSSLHPQGLSTPPTHSAVKQKLLRELPSYMALFLDMFSLPGSYSILDFHPISCWHPWKLMGEWGQGHHLPLGQGFLWPAL